MRLTIRTAHPYLYAELQKDLPAGARLASAPPLLMRRSLDPVVQALELVIELAKDVDVALFAAWLYERVQPVKQYAQVEVDRVQVDCDEGEIRRIISERIRVNRDN